MRDTPPELLLGVSDCVHVMSPTFAFFWFYIHTIVQIRSLNRIRIRTTNAVVSCSPSPQPEIKNPAPFQIIFRLAAVKKGTYLLFIGLNRLRDRDYEVRIHGIRSGISLYLFNHVFIPTKENPPVYTISHHLFGSIHGKPV